MEPCQICWGAAPHDACSSQTSARIRGHTKPAGYDGKRVRWLHCTVTSLPRRKRASLVVGVAVGPIVISDGRCSSSCLLSSAPHSLTSPRVPTVRASTSLTRIGASSARSRATTTSAGNMVAAAFYLWQAWWSARAGRKGRHELCSSQPHKPPTNHPAHPLMQKFFRCAGQIAAPCGARYPSWGEARLKRRQVRTKST